MGSFLVQLPPGLDISQAEDIGNGSFKVGKHTYDLTPSHIPLDVCLLNKSGGQYELGEAPTKLMELTRSVALPKIDKSVVQPRSHIPQVQNLKARHFASGYAKAASEASEASEPSQKRPVEHVLETPKKKQKKDKKEKTPKSEKKHKKSKDKGSKA